MVVVQPTAFLSIGQLDFNEQTKTKNMKTISKILVIWFFTIGIVYRTFDILFESVFKKQKI